MLTWAWLAMVIKRLFLMPPGILLCILVFEQCHSRALSSGCGTRRKTFQAAVSIHLQTTLTFFILETHSVLKSRYRYQGPCFLKVQKSLVLLAHFATECVLLVLRFSRSVKQCGKPLPGTVLQERQEMTWCGGVLSALFCVCTLSCQVHLGILLHEVSKLCCSQWWVCHSALVPTCLS